VRHSTVDKTESAAESPGGAVREFISEGQRDPLLLRGIEWKTLGAVQKLLDVMGVRTTGPFTAHGKASVVGKEVPSSSREPASDGDMHHTAPYCTAPGSGLPANQLPGRCGWGL
jgi:hypothetical protein